MAMDFEAKHRECVRVLTYTDDGHVKVKLFVLSGKSGIPETLKAAAQYIFKEMDVKLEWLDLYRDVDEILKIRPLKYPSGTQQVLEDSQVDEINKTIYKNLHVLVRHRNITAVQPSLKITNSKQTGIPCITLYVLCKGIIPDGECSFPLTLVLTQLMLWMEYGSEPMMFGSQIKHRNKARYFVWELVLVYKERMQPGP